MSVITVHIKGDKIQAWGENGQPLEQGRILQLSSPADIVVQGLADPVGPLDRERPIVRSVE